MRGFEVLRLTGSVRCLSDDRYGGGTKHLKALHEAGMEFEVVSDPAIAVRYLLNTHQQLGISCQVMSVGAEPVVQVSSMNGTVAVTAPASVAPQRATVGEG